MNIITRSIMKLVVTNSLFSFVGCDQSCLFLQILLNLLLLFVSSVQATDKDSGIFGVVRYYLSDEPDQ